MKQQPDSKAGSSSINAACFGITLILYYLHMISFKKNYFILTILLFLVEIGIALYVHDEIIRPYGGDLLVVIMLYCLVKSLFDADSMITALFVLVFSYTLETLQYFHIVQVLGLENSPIARVIIGTSFAWTDILAYTLGIMLVFAVEKLIKTV